MYVAFLCSEVLFYSIPCSGSWSIREANGFTLFVSRNLIGFPSILCPFFLVLIDVFTRVFNQLREILLRQARVKVQEGKFGQIE